VKYSLQIGRVELVTSFELDQAFVLSAGPQLRRVAETEKAQLLTLNSPPMVNPDLPRLVLATKDMQLHVALTRLQFVIHPPDHIANSFEESLNFALARAADAQKLLFGQIKRYAWTGLVVALDFCEKPLKSKDMISASMDAFKRLTRLDWSDKKTAAFNLQAGYKNGDFFRTYTVSGFERRMVRVTQDDLSEGRTPTFEDGDLKAIGVEVLLDINDKPSKRHGGPKADLKRVAQEAVRSYKDFPNDLGLEDLAQ